MKRRVEPSSSMLPFIPARNQNSIAKPGFQKTVAKVLLPINLRAEERLQTWSFVKKHKRSKTKKNVNRANFAVSFLHLVHNPHLPRSKNADFIRIRRVKKSADQPMIWEQVAVGQCCSSHVLVDFNKKEFKNFIPIFACIFQGKIKGQKEA